MRYLAALAAIVLGGLCLGQGPRHTEQEKAEDTRLLVLGQVTWAGLDWTPAGGVLAASDPRFKDVVATAPLNREGRFVLFIEPGNYYLMAYVDVNANGRPDAPDGVGFYGVRQPTDAPAPLEVLPDSPADPVAIEVVFQLDEDRKLRRAAIGQEAALGCVRGVVQGNRGMHVYVVCWPAGDGWIGHASTPAADGSFEIPVPAGDYVVFAVCDSDGDGVVQPGDPAGILAENGVLRVARVLPQEHVELAAMELNGKLNEAGQVEVGEQAIELPGARIPALCRLAVPEGLQALPRQVLLFAEAAHKTLLARAWAPSEALLALRPATYYLVCGFDQDRDGQLGPGDALAAPVAAGGRRGLSVQEATFMDVVLGEPVALSGDLVDGKRTGGQQ